MVDLTVAQGGMKLGNGGLIVSQRGIYSDIVDMTVAQKGMKLGDARFDCCTGRYETQGW